MPGHDSRVARAGDYILGLMSDAERERAERDLEVDAAFRDTVMQMAERMRVFDRAIPDNDPSDGRWKFIAGRIAELPQMQFTGVDRITKKPIIGSTPLRSIGIGLHALPNRRTLAVALGLILAFVLGYLAGRF
jgi:anti-sigma-K factor RskA